MAENGGYHQFCPVAMASEILCKRWTVVLLRELLVGSTRFNDLRKGVPRMSPALLSTRLKELERAGILERRATKDRKVFDYLLTEAGRDLQGVVMGIGTWGQRWVESQVSLKNLDPTLLMWDMRRNLNPTPMPDRKCVVQFLYPELAKARRSYWMIVTPPDDVDLCSVDPGFDVDLYVTSDLKTMTSIWMGLSKVKQEVNAGSLVLTGNRELARRMQTWLGLSPFAVEQKRVAG